MSVRTKSVEILQTIIEEKVFFNTLKDQISPKDLAFANMLVLVSLRHYNGLQKLIGSFLKKPLPASRQILKYVMVCAAAEILFMDTPDYAAINEYVDIGKKFTNRYAGGMINAILRKIVSDKKTFLMQVENDLMPLSFQKILKTDYKPEIIKQCAEQIGKIPPTDLSVLEDPEAWAEKLNGVLFANGTVRIKNLPSKISNLAGYEEGKWWVQDLAASLPVFMLKNIEGLKVLDLCAAPGGKTAQLLAAGAHVTAVDIDPLRLQKLNENIRRLHLEKHLKTHAADGLEFLEQTRDNFDIILLDVPCSATGTYRRHPEVLHLKSIKDVEKQISIQQKLLDSAVNKLKTNGRLLYCTCSLAKAEGEKQIAHFLEKHSDFEIVRLDESCFNFGRGIKFENYFFDKGVLRTLPYYMKEHGGMDGFFAACLQRKN